MLRTFARLRRPCIVLAASAVQLSAQSLRGRILRTDSVTPVPGVVVTARSADGSVRTALSSASGAYALELSPGRYEVRVLHIGFRPVVLTGVDLTQGVARSRDIVLSELPVNLAAMGVQSSRSCDLRKEDASHLLLLWEQARGALVANRLSQERDDLDVVVVMLDGHVDATNFHEDPGIGPLLRSPHADEDTLHAREAAVHRIFATSPVETLVDSGFLRRLPGGGDDFDAPSAELLLSDSFIDGHCFSIATPPREHPDWIGVAFEPKRARDGIVDIRGTLWLDRTNAELRRLDFDYANVRPTEFKLCDPEPDVQHARAGANCVHISDDGNRLGIGGTEDFLRLPTGEWFIDQWTMRTWPDQVKWRFSGNRIAESGHAGERCFSGKDCREIWMTWPRLVTNIGIVSNIRRAGAELYRNDAARAIVDVAARRTAGAHPAGLSGLIIGDQNQRLAGAVIQIEDPGRVAITNSFGQFSIVNLAPRLASLVVRCRGFKSVRLSIPLLADSTRSIDVRLVPDTTAVLTPSPPK